MGMTLDLEAGEINKQLNTILGKNVKILTTNDRIYNNGNIDYEQLKQVLMENRNLTVEDLDTKLSKLPSPKNLPNVEEAVDKLLFARRHNKTVILYGDYDVDGITSTYIMKDFLESNGFSVKTFIPKRTDGYGLSETALNLLSQTSDIVMTLDNGTNAINEIKHGEIQHGMNFIVLDHHRVNDLNVLSDVKATIVNPYIEQDNPLHGLCTASLSFYMTRFLREKINTKFNTKKYLDAVAIATIADVMPIHYINRALAKQGISLINEISQLPIPLYEEQKFYEELNLNVVGLKALLQVLDLDQRLGTPITFHDIGMKIVPLINAAGRMETAEIALNLLSSKTYEEALPIARRMKEINDYRKYMTEQIYQEALEQALASDDEFIVIGNPNWHHGILGLVSLKLAMRLKKPVAVFHIGDKYAVGSIRTTGDINVYDLIASASYLVEKWGGHQQALGLRIKTENLDLLRAKLNESLQREYTIEPQPVEVDLQLPLSNVHMYKDIRPEILDIINTLAPFGPLNPEPVFLSDICTILDVQYRNNVALIYALENNSKIRVACFNREIYEHPYIQRGNHVQFVYSVNNNGSTILDVIAQN